MGLTDRDPQPLSGPTSGPFADALLTWTATHRRDLPWRRTRDPWAVLVSELMLQQTQVPRVVSRYPEVLARFPTPAACAGAAPGDVVAAWAGLGYNRRALNLHRCATAVVDLHGGLLPDDLAALMALPGIGPYTARAVLAFAFERDVGVVDVNAGRVLARVAGRRLSLREVQDVADGAVPVGRGWEWNQAILDLGATVCTKRSPRCERCPVAESCGWRQRGGADPATGSAGEGRRQSAFAGSDRQGAGRLVTAARRGPVARADLADAAGWPDDPERAVRVARRLLDDGLLVEDGERLRLP